MLLNVRTLMPVPDHWDSYDRNILCFLVGFSLVKITKHMQRRPCRLLVLGEYSV